MIGGFGRVGQTIARVLRQENVLAVALDTNAPLVTEHRKAGRLVFFGDASRRELLERAGAASARAFVVTLDAPGATERMVEEILALRPDACVFARAKDPDHAARLAKLGAAASSRKRSRRACSSGRGCWKSSIFPRSWSPSGWRPRAKRSSDGSRRC